MTTESYRFAKRYGVLVLDEKSTPSKVACSEKASMSALAELRRHFKKPFVIEKVSSKTYNELLTKTYQTKSGVAMQAAENLGEALGLKELIQELPNTSDLLESEDDATIIRMINAIFSEAIKL